MFGRKEPEQRARQLRIVIKGGDIDAAKALSLWLLERYRADALAGLARPAANPVDGIDITIDPVRGGRPLAGAAALACEMVWAGVPFNVLTHVGKPGNHALLRADLVIDMRSPAARSEGDLAMDMTFLCPDAAFAVHEPGADLAQELERAYASAHDGATDAAPAAGI